MPVGRLEAAGTCNRLHTQIAVGTSTASGTAPTEKQRQYLCFTLHLRAVQSSAAHRGRLPALFCARRPAFTRSIKLLRTPHQSAPSTCSSAKTSLSNFA